MIKQNYYPGMITNEVEFFTTGEELKVINKGKIYSFKELDASIIKILSDAMKQDQNAQAVLIKWFPNQELKQVEKFTQCRFGGLDFNPDINSAGKLQKGEYYQCPFRGKCEGEGVVCRNIRHNGNEITNEEIQLIKLLVTDLTNEDIADEMNLKLGTLHFKKRVLYEKLEITTKQQLTLFAVQHNIVLIK